MEDVLMIYNLMAKGNLSSQVKRLKSVKAAMNLDTIPSSKCAPLEKREKYKQYIKCIKLL